jgi:hypothetical protein
VCKETDRAAEAKETATIRPFAAQGDENVETTRRQSNFDRSMIDLHCSTERQVMGRHSLAQARNSLVALDDDGISHWGAVDGAPTGSNHHLATQSADDEEYASEGSQQEEEADSAKYDRRITGMGTVPLNSSDGGGINFNTTTGTGSSAGTSFSSKWKRLSKKEFSFRMNMLEKHRKWVERAARR